MALAAEALGKPQFPWQRYVCNVGLEVLPDGSWAYDEVIVLVQRRAGKTVLIEPITTHRCGQAGPPRSAWITAQKRDNAVKRWRDAAGVIERALGRGTVKRNISNSHELLEWRSTGSKFVPFAPDEETMHGEDPDLVWVDELWSHSIDKLAMIEDGFRPAWSVKTGQEWKLSAAGTLASTALKRDRARGRAAVESGGRSRIAFFEWCVPETVGGSPVAELPDEQLLDVVLANHPRRDHGLRRDFLAEELGKGRPSFLRHYGGLDDDHLADDTVIPWGRFSAASAQLAGVAIPADARIALGFEVDPLSREGAVLAGWRDPGSGRAVVEVVARRDDTRWVAGEVLRLVDRHEVGLVAAVGAGPARDVADAVEQGLDGRAELLRVTMGDFGAATRRFSDSIVQDEPASVLWADSGEGDLVSALRAASWRRLPSGHQLFGSAGGEPITALGAGVLALWAADHMPAEEAPPARFRIL